MDALIGLPTSVLIGALFAYLIAGTVKGTLGIGLPTAGVSLTAQFTDARTAIALVILPMLLTNAWQVWRTREHAHRAIPYWPLALTMTISIAGFALIAPSITIQWITLLLGVTVVIFASVSLWRDVPALNPKYDKPAQLTAGFFSGVLGGLTGVWAPPIIIYMSSIRVDKTTFVGVVGVLLLIGSTVLAASYSSNGLLSSEHAIASLLLVIPAIVGFSFGERIRHKLNEERFKRLILLFFLVMGLNLVRKAFF